MLYCTYFYSVRNILLCKHIIHYKKNTEDKLIYIYVCVYDGIYLRT